MTTDNKTLAVDVLAVMDREAKLARHYRIENGAVKVAEEASADAYAARESVAGLIEALILARSELSGLPHSLGYSFTHLPKIDAALARVKGESA